MSKTVLVHGGWGFAALAAFGIGTALSNKSASREQRDGGEIAGHQSGGGDQFSAASTGVSGLTNLKKREDDGVLKPLSERDILNLGRIVQTDGSPVARRLAFAKLLEGITAENALQIREQLVGISERSSEWRDFHYAWGTVAGEEAVAHGMDSPEHDMAVTLSGWASTNPRAAMDWYDSLPPEQRLGNGELKRGMAGGLADRDPNEAADFVFSLAAAGDNEAGRMLSDVTYKVIRNEGVLGAAEWSENLQAGQLRATAMDRVADAYVDHDPAQAMRWAEQFNHDSGSARVIEEVAEEVSKRDPEFAFNWLDSLPASDGRDLGLRTSFRRFARRGTSVAAARANTLSDPSARDAALTGIAIQAGDRSEASAFGIIAQISEPESRAVAAVLAAPRFTSMDDPSNAISWVDNNFSQSASVSDLRDGSPGSEQVALHAIHDPELSRRAALEWIGTLDQEAGRTEAARLSR